MQEYEYYSLEIDPNFMGLVYMELNEYAAKGWRLKQMVSTFKNRSPQEVIPLKHPPQDPVVHAIFERRKK
jgi:hypothetical protein